jgi:hypothetical protein
MFGQGTLDSDRASRILGQRQFEDRSWSNDGRETVRLVDRETVSARVLEDLQPGTAWLRVPPVKRKRARVECVRVALPAPLPLGAARGSLELGTPTESLVGTLAASVGTPDSAGPTVSPLPADKAAALQRVRELVQVRGEDECWRIVWPEGVKGTDDRGRPRIKVSGRYVKTYQLVYEETNGELGEDEGLDHTCHNLMCHNLRHLEGVSSEENTRRRHESARRRERARANGSELNAELAIAAVEQASPADPAGAVSTDAGLFNVALFAGIDRPAVEQKTLSLDELRQMLGKFEILADKRRGRCWSPTRFADGASSRGNAGVREVSALVFDVDRVPPDPERLDGVYWLGHAPWSHRPEQPKWRVIIPLATPVSATNWRDVWQHARAALCPEADPASKDPSWAYWLPSHSGGVTAKATCHDGPLLNASTLPRPPEPERPELQHTPSVRVVRRTPDSDRRRGEGYMDSVIASLEAAMPGGRNAALNRAAWTLGRWVAAGALEQSEVEDELYAAAAANGIVAAYGDRQYWATIRSGLSAGLQQPIDLDADRR